VTVLRLDESASQFDQTCSVYLYYGKLNQTLALGVWIDTEIESTSQSTVLDLTKLYLLQLIESGPSI